MTRTVLILFSGNVGSALLSLVRNLIIARLLPVEDYGIAATFAMAITGVETLTNIGMHQQLVQSRRGEDPAFQASLQGFNLLRGLVGAVILFMAAGSIADFLGIPEVAWAYQVLALLPVLFGLQHYDFYRFKRQMRFGPEMIVVTLPVFVSLLSVWPAFVLLGDYRVMLVAILVQWGLVTLLSHLCAVRSFRLGFDRTIIAGAISFGWPILINGVLMYVLFNGEKLIVGRELGTVELGLLAIGLTFATTPTMVLTRIVQSFFLPQLSALQDDPTRFQTTAMVTIQAVLAATLLYLAAVVLVLRPLCDLLLGDEYGGVLPLVIWLGIMVGLRLVRAGPAVVALSQAQTSNEMWSNIARLSLLPFAWWVVAEGGSLLTLIWLGILAETLGLIVSFLLVRYRLQLSLRPLVGRGLATGAVFACAAWLAWTTQEMLWISSGQSALMLALTCVAMWSLRPLWTYIARRDMIRMGF